jgi:23S rRNA maturation-related 3'-5' exoribonuclease YhaM
MVIEFDEKGKYFTEVITKDLILSHIQTQTYHIRGNIHVRKDERLSDEVNSDNGFLAVTDAEIYSHDGSVLYTCKFMVVNRAHIVWLMPINAD